MNQGSVYFSWRTPTRCMCMRAALSPCPAATRRPLLPWGGWAMCNRWRQYTVSCAATPTIATPTMYNTQCTYTDYSDLKTKLSEFLNDFAKNKKVRFVTALPIILFSYRRLCPREILRVFLRTCKSTRKDDWRLGREFHPLTATFRTF